MVIHSMEKKLEKDKEIVSTCVGTVEGTWRSIKMLSQWFR